MFDHSAILVFTGDDEEAALDALMLAEVDVSDIESEDGKISVFAPHTDYFKAKQALSEAFAEIDFEVDEIQFIPQNPSPISADELAQLEIFLDMLNDLDDVQNVYHNVENAE
jgi:transcriptional/translational regulatory protein YebC/TACO1